MKENNLTAWVGKCFILDLQKFKKDFKLVIDSIDEKSSAQETREDKINMASSAIINFLYSTSFEVENKTLIIYPALYTAIRNIERNEINSIALCNVINNYTYNH